MPSRCAMKGLGEIRRSEYLAWCSADERAASIEKVDAGEVMLHQVQVVNRSEDRDALLAKMMKQVDEFGLPSDIEVLRGFVEQQELRFLGEAKCDLDALTFAAAQFVEDAMAKLEAVGKIESTIDGHPILAHESPKQAEVRGASLLDDLLNMEFERNIELL